MDKTQNTLACWGINRSNYRVVPGLYSIGAPGDESPVLVTANYKLSFDMLRKELSDMNLWILVIDTFGINVWCAAGKGTFGTDEVVNRIKISDLERHTKSRQLILPQLGAPGVSGWMVTKKTSFKVAFGPVRSSDLKSFILSGNLATEEMRTVTFNIGERWSVTPIELVHNFLFVFASYFAVLFLKFLSGQSLQASALNSLAGTLPYAGAIIMGALVFPLVLPLLPFRYFSIKGAVLGLFWFILMLFLPIWHQGNGLFLYIGSGLLMISITSGISLNFTGSTTFTSYSGVKKEMDVVLIPLIVSGGGGILMLIVSALLYKIA